MIYFDHAASTPLYPEVLDVLHSSMKDDFANSSAKHILGHDLNENLNLFRNDFLKVLNAARNDEFIFTSSATESNNTVIKGLSFKEGESILYCLADHPSVTEPALKMSELHKLKLKEIVLDAEGRIDENHFISLLDESVKLVILTMVNNQSGVVTDIEKYSKLVKEKTKAHVHVDAVQAFTKVNVQISAHIDSMSVTSHKIGGPKGIAGLYLKHNHKVQTLLDGGGHENKMRSSTVAYPLVKGFHQAMKISMKNRDSSKASVQKIKSEIKQQLSASISTLQMPFKETSPYILSFILPGISSDIILRHLEMKKVFISSSSACSSRISGFNPTLFAMNIPEKFHKNFLRISLSPLTTEVEGNAFVKEFMSVWDSVKNMQKR